MFSFLKYGIDILWIGARTTVNPFSVQEIADAVKGTDTPILVKNPINPDLSLWMGALERINKAGITKLGAIHRGFSMTGSSGSRRSCSLETVFRFDLSEITCNPNSHGL